MTRPTWVVALLPIVHLAIILTAVFLIVVMIAIVVAHHDWFALPVCGLLFLVTVADFSLVRKDRRIADRIDELEYRHDTGKGSGWPDPRRQRPSDWSDWVFWTGIALVLAAFGWTMAVKVLPSIPDRSAWNDGFAVLLYGLSAALLVAYPVLGLWKRKLERYLEAFGFWYDRVIY